MHKILLNSKRNETDTLITTLAITGLFTGLLCSRALLSISLVVLLGWMLYSRTLKTAWSRYISSPLYWLPSIFILPVLVSSFWSHDLAEWGRSLQVKLPLFVIPFVIAAWQPDHETRRRVQFIFMGTMLAGMIWSLGRYYTGDLQATDYLRGKVIDVPMGNDHVRYGWALGIFWLILLFEAAGHYATYTRPQRWLAFTAAVFFVVYTTLLGSKTGLICFYLVSAIAFFTSLKRLRVASLLLLLMIPLAGWFLFPNFQNRVRYVVWDAEHYLKGQYTPGLSDMNRVLSIRAGVGMFGQHPLIGVGFGDVRKGKEEWFDANMPQVEKGDRIMVSDTFLIYAAGAGIGGLIISLFAGLLPFVHAWRGWRNGHWVLPVFQLTALLQLLYEPVLELQYGIFIYAFFSAWFACGAERKGKP